MVEDVVIFGQFHVFGDGKERGEGEAVEQAQPAPRSHGFQRSLSAKPSCLALGNGSTNQDCANAPDLIRCLSSRSEIWYVFNCPSTELLRRGFRPKGRAGPDSSPKDICGP
ncbi:hypothetical protein KC331_g6 [Hortaea werneckii]|nr:hypothetical protein KC331_g6 [Hortaea werneckii]